MIQRFNYTLAFHFSLATFCEAGVSMFSFETALVILLVTRWQHMP